MSGNNYFYSLTCATVCRSRFVSRPPIEFCILFLEKKNYIKLFIFSCVNVIFHSIFSSNESEAYTSAPSHSQFIHPPLLVSIILFKQNYIIVLDLMVPNAGTIKNKIHYLPCWILLLYDYYGLNGSELLVQKNCQKWFHVNHNIWISSLKIQFKYFCLEYIR